MIQSLLLATGKPNELAINWAALGIRNGSASSWVREMELEAARGAMEVQFGLVHGALTATFTDAEFTCYSREWRP